MTSMKVSTVTKQNSKNKQTNFTPLAGGSFLPLGRDLVAITQKGHLTALDTITTISLFRGFYGGRSHVMTNTHRSNHPGLNSQVLILTQKS